MKILIATPIHELKDYSMRRWLKSVSEIKVDNSDEWKLLMVDNSQNPNYQEKVRGYCKELGFVNYNLLHIGGMIDSDEYTQQRLGISREEIRQKLLNEDWDYWFSWECDIICPSNILTTLLKYSSDCDVVGHTYPLRRTRNDKGSYMELESMGLMLFPKRIFLNYGFTKGKIHRAGDGPLLNEIIAHWKWISLHNCLTIEHLNDT